MAQQHNVLAIPLDEIAESKTNPRKIFHRAKLDEMAGTIMQHGVLQPVTVRPCAQKNGKAFELVLGAQRWRASHIAKQATIPAIVRDLSDDQVLDLQLIENVARGDLTPLEEGDAYREQVKRGRTHEEIAAKVGVSKGTIYARIKLAELVPSARKALAEERISASIGLLLARIADPERQAEACAVIAKGDQYNGGEAYTYRDARELIEEKWMRELKGAPWKLDDAELVPAAGPCTTCPNRSGNQRELFGDAAAKTDVCTKPSCFESKIAAHRKALLDAAREQGRQVIEGKDAKGLFNQWGDVDRGQHVALDEPCRDDPKRRTYRQLLGKDAVTASAVAVNPKSGDTVELVPQKGLTRLLKERGHDFAATRQRSSMRASHSAKPKPGAHDFRGAVLKAAGARLAAAGRDEVGKLDGALWRLVAAFSLGRYYVALDVDDVLEARGIIGPIKPGTGYDSRQRKIQAWLKSAGPAELRSAVAHALLLAFGEGFEHRSDNREEVTTVCKLFGVDLKKVEADVAAYLKAAAPPAPKKTASKKAPKRKPAENANGRKRA